MPNIIEFKNGNLHVWVWMSQDPVFVEKFATITQRDQAEVHAARDLVLNDLFAHNVGLEITPDINLAAILLYGYANMILQNPHKTCFDSNCGVNFQLLGVNLTGAANDGIGFGIYAIGHPVPGTTLEQFEELLKQAAIAVKD